MSLKPSRILELGDAYASTTVNTTIFRHNGVVTHGNWQFTAYYTSNNTDLPPSMCPHPELGCGC
jgi:hypothetical protein